MNQILKFVYLLCAGGWAGTVVFFSVAVVRVARQLEPRQASRFLGRIFPQYYLAQIVWSAVGFLSALALVSDRQFGPPLWGMVAVILLAGITGINVWIRFAILPLMAKIRDRIAVFKEEGHDPDKSLAGEWNQLHTLTVVVNIASLITALIMLAIGLKAML